MAGSIDEYTFLMMIEQLDVNHDSSSRRPSSSEARPEAPRRGRETRARRESAASTPDAPWVIFACTFIAVERYLF